MIRELAQIISRQVCMPGEGIREEADPPPPFASIPSRPHPSHVPAEVATPLHHGRRHWLRAWGRNRQPRHLLSCSPS